MTGRFPSMGPTNMQVVASNSLYFSKYALDEEEKYRETQQKEVVLDWSQIESDAFNKILATFKLWLDLNYSLIGSHRNDGFTASNWPFCDPFFSMHPLCAGCILEYFLCPDKALKEYAKRNAAHMNFPAFVNDFSNLQPLFGGDWMSSFIEENILWNLEDLSHAIEIIDTDWMDTIVNVLQEKLPMADATSHVVKQKIFFLNLYAAFLWRNHDDTPVPFKVLFKKVVGLWTIPAPSLFPDCWKGGSLDEKAKIFHSLLAVLETESRLGLAGDLKEVEFEGSMFNLTDLQHIFTSLMAPSGGHMELFQKNLMVDSYKVNERLKKSPAIAKAFRAKQKLLMGSINYGGRKRDADGTPQS